MIKSCVKIVLPLFLAIFLAGCSQSSIGYIQLLASSDTVLDRFNDVRNIFISDKRFVLNDFSTQPASWIREASFAYDPTPENDAPHIQYHILVKANTDTGDLVAFFHEFATKEMSNQGKKIFGELVIKTKEKFGDDSIQYGVDDKARYWELSALFKS